MKEKILNISPLMVKNTAEKRAAEVLSRDRNTEREKLAGLLGMEKFRPAPADLQLVNLQNREDHLLYDMTMDTEPGVTMPFFLLTPPDAELLPGAPPGEMNVVERHFLSDYPVVIVPHGHGSDGRYGPVGIDRHREMEENRKRFHHDIGLQFVRRGYIVLCPDARGAGDRRNPKEQGMEPEKLLSSSCRDLNNALTSMGSCLTAAWCWDLMALISLIVDRGWGDHRKIGVCGFSGGGLQALFLSALESRIRCAAVSGYFFKHEDCLLDSNLCSCNFIPSFPLHFDHASLAALAAPGALIIEKAVSDPLNGSRGISGPRELIEDVRKVYRQMGREEQFAYSEVEGTHHFSGRDIFPFFDSQMSDSSKNYFR